MAEPIESISYLANSENRVRVLTAVSETSRTRASLQEESGVARATLGRILSELEAREWILQNGNYYEATPKGRHLISEFESMLATVSVLDELGDDVQWFPIDAVSFELGRLQDARITRPSSVDSIAPVRRAAAKSRDAEEVLGLTSVFAPDALRGNHQAVLDHGQGFEIVVPQSVIEVVTADTESRRLLRELLEAESARAYRYDDELSYPFNIWIVDGQAVIGISDGHGAPRALIETDDSAVRAWVRSTIESHREDATRINAEDIRD